MSTFTGFPADSYAFTANEVGLALAGLIARDVNGIPQVGVLGYIPTVAPVAESWNVLVTPFVYVHEVDGAAQFSGVSADETVAITPAVGSIVAGQSRIDLICWDPLVAELSVVTGVPSTTPVRPSPGGLAPFAEVRVNAADSTVVNGQIKPVFALSALASAGGDIGWTPMTILDGTNHSLYPVQVMRKDGLVYMRGKSRPVGNAALQFVLPEGMRPIEPFTVILSTEAGGVAQVATNINGNVRFNIGPVRFIDFAGFTPFLAG